MNIFLALCKQEKYGYRENNRKHEFAAWADRSATNPAGLLTVATHTTEAICISRSPFRETSQVAHWITRDFGRIACLAKGAYRDKNRFEGNEDILTLSRITFFLRPGQGLGLLRERRLIDYFYGLRKDLGRLSAGYLLLEVVRRSIQEGQKIEYLFDLLKQILSALSGCEGTADIILFTFLGRFLRMIGFEPVLSRCTTCDRDAAEANLLYIDPGQGGVVCRNCRSDMRQGVVISSEAAAVIESAAHAKRMAVPDRTLAQGVSRELWAFFEFFLTYVLERKLDTFDFAREHLARRD